MNLSWLPTTTTEGLAEEEEGKEGRRVVCGSLFPSKFHGQCVDSDTLIRRKAQNITQKYHNIHPHMYTSRTNQKVHKLAQEHWQGARERVIDCGVLAFGGACARGLRRGIWSGADCHYIICRLKPPWRTIWFVKQTHAPTHGQTNTQTGRVVVVKSRLWEPN